jgi:hypothetical protein
MKRVLRASWLALLATSTLGADSTTLLAEVQLDDSVRNIRGTAPQRLIVQVYAGRPGDLSEESKPTSSAQRAVTLEQLREGIAVHLVDVKPESALPAPNRLTVVAWVEPGVPDLELDALKARPPAGKPFGRTSLAPEAERVRIRLRSETRGG